MPNVEFIPLSLVDDYDKNSNTHPQAQIENIKALMLYVGWTVPALVRKTGERYGLIAGHGRREAANELQGKPLKMADGTPIPAGCIPVLFADGWSDEQIRAYVIADNQVPRQSVFDESILAEELQALQDGGLDLGMIGFGEGELERLLASMEPEPEYQTDPDDAPAVDEWSTPVSVRGMVWLCGRHRVMCGDSTLDSDIENLVNCAEVDTVVFDPPYENELLYDAIPFFGKYSKLVVFWDFKRFGIAPAKAIQKNWTPQYEFIWDCVQSWYTPNRPLQRHKACGYFSNNPFFDEKKSIIYDNKDRGSARSVSNTRGTYKYTPIEGGKHIASVESIPNTQLTDDGHSHGKPVIWIESIYNGIGASVVLSMFGGGGSDMLACEKNEQTCLTMELEPIYCDAIVKRWQQFTGKAATLEYDGRTFDEIASLCP